MQDINKEWTYKDLEELVLVNREEDQYIDFKDSRIFDDKDWKDKLRISASAFANASGGVIITGIDEKDEEGKNTDKAQRLDKGIDPNKVKKNTIEQVIRDGIEPKINFSTDEITDSKKNKYYVIKIPKSNSTPHQVVTENECRYYQRHNSSCLKLKHFQILDLINRRSGPDLESRISMIKLQSFRGRAAAGKIGLNFEIKNNGLVGAKWLIFKIWLDEILVAQYNSYDFDKEENQVVEINTSSEDPSEPFNASKLTFKKNFEVPIFGSDWFSFPSPNVVTHASWNVEFNDAKSLSEKGFYIKWQIETENMVPRYWICHVKYNQDGTFVHNLIEHDLVN